MHKLFTLLVLMLTALALPMSALAAPSSQEDGRIFDLLEASAEGLGTQHIDGIALMKASLASPQLPSVAKKLIASALQKAEEGAELPNGAALQALARKILSAAKHTEVDGTLRENGPLGIALMAVAGILVNYVQHVLIAHDKSHGYDGSVYDKRGLTRKMFPVLGGILTAVVILGLASPV